MSSTRQSLTPLLERRNLEITRLRAEVAELKAKIVELETALEAAKKTK